jgi:hypothetical protein
MQRKIEQRLKAESEQKRVFKIEQKRRQKEKKFQIKRKQRKEN